MVDKLLRGPKEQVLAPIATRIFHAVHPTALTFTAFGIGLAAAIVVSQGAYGIGVGLWVLNRLLDGLDGTVARLHHKQSDLGGYLDMVLDTVIYAALPVALVLSRPDPMAWLSLAFLLSSFYINGASWMYLAALLEKRRQGSGARGELTTITMPGGLIEGTETVLFYTLFLVFPGSSVYLFTLMGLLVVATVGQRLVWAMEHLHQYTFSTRSTAPRSPGTARPYHPIDGHATLPVPHGEPPVARREEHTVMTTEQPFSTIVLGAGSGGLTVALGLAALGKRVALIERHAVGGDCTNVGCIPSKTLIHLAAEQSDGPGNGSAVLAEVQAKRNRLRDTETDEVRHTEYLEFFHGRGCFTGPKQIEVTLENGRTRMLTADNIVIATGSRPTTLTIEGLPLERTLTNENLFELSQPPGHLAIVGSGPIALEMAFAFRDLGTDVSIVTLDERVFANSPAEASQVLRESLAERGVAVYYGATATRYDALSKTLVLKTPDGPVELATVDKVLLAIGQTRNIEALGLEHAGVSFDPKTGIPVDSFGRTNVPGIFAIGDVTPTSHWTHSANAQGRRVVQRIAFPWLPAFGREPVYPNATFSNPKVANVGLMPEQIARKYHPKLVKTVCFELAETDRGYTEGLKHGFVQVSALRLTGRILGATIVGPRAGEMISFFTLAISEGVSLYTLFRLVYPYPTHSGAIQKVADQYVRETLPAFHTELFDLVRYGAATVWQRLRGREFEPPATPAAQTIPQHTERVGVA